MKKLGIIMLAVAMIIVFMASMTSVLAATSIKAQEFNGGTATTVNTLNPNINLVNTGTDPITLSNVRIRYYYTNDGTQTNGFACDWATAGNGNITGIFIDVTPVTNMDRYCEIGFTSAA
jgi:xyloglucan-specific exo-beta-1,4-glucanase